MNLNSVAHAIRSGSEYERVIHVLGNFNHPLTEREKEALHAFTTEYNEKIEGGAATKKDLEIPDNMQALLQRPVVAIPATSAIMCIVLAAKMTSTPQRTNRSLQKIVLPKIVKAAPSLVASDWAPILNASASLLGVGTIAALRCAEEVLRHSLPVVVKGDKEFGQWCKLVSGLLKKYAFVHSLNGKHGALTLTSVATGHSAFLSSVRVSRLRRSLIACPEASAKLAVVAESMTSSQCTDALPLAILNFLAFGTPVSKAILTTVPKVAPGLLFQLLGNSLRVSANSIDVTEFDDTVLHCFYNMGLTTTTEGSALDFVALLSALPSVKMQAYLVAKTGDVITQLLNPIINNPKVFHVALMRNIAEAFARIIDAAGVTDQFLKPLAAAVSQSIGGRCRSGDDKASVIAVLDAVCRVVKVGAPDRCPLTSAEVQPIVRSELDNAALEGARAAWKLVNTNNASTGLAAIINPAIKNSVHKDDNRRIILTYLAAQYPEANALTKELLSECAEVVTFRPDAYFALPFALHSGATVVVANTCKIVLKADVIAAFTSRDDILRAAEVAIALATGGHYDALALMLTHSSGEARKVLQAYVGSVSGSPSTIISIWDSLVRTVFGLEANEKPSICSATAQPAVSIVAAHLLKHTAKLVIDSALVEVLLCFGHDNVLGHDPLFFVPNRLCIGQYRTSSSSFDRRPFERLFTLHKHLFQLHSESICEGLCQKLSGVPHVASAAARALSLFLHTVTPAITANVFQRIRTAVEASSKFFAGLPKLDAVIATGCRNELESYIRQTLTEKNLLKTYTPKPPKGMNEEDYEDMKKKDAIALKAGREQLEKEIAKRRHAIEATIRSHCGPLVAVRVIGSSGGCKWWDGVPIIYPALQSMIAMQPVVTAAYHLALDAVVGLLSQTTLNSVAELIATIVGRLHNVPSLTQSDVNAIAAVAHSMRQSNAVHLLPSPIFSILIPFCCVAFKASAGTKNAKVIPVQTQHQLISMLNANVGQEHLPEQKACLSLYFEIVGRFSALYKAVLHGSQTLATRIKACDVAPIYHALLNGADLVKECAANALTKFEHFESTRTALIVAATMQHDESTSVNQCMTVILKQHKFELAEDDWEPILHLLKTYGKRASTTNKLTLVMNALLDKFPSSQVYAVERIIALGGLSAVQTLEKITKHFTPASTLATLEFFTAAAEDSSASEDLMQAILAAGKTVLNGCSIDVLNQVSPQFQPRLKKPPTSSTAEHKEQYTALAVVWLTIMGCRANDIAFLETVIDQQAQALNTSASANVHYFVCDCLTEIAGNKAFRSSEKLNTFVENCMKVAITSGAYIKKKANAYGLAGVVLGLGVSSLRRFNVMPQILAAAKEKQAQRSGAMILVEVLSDVLGCSFEPYSLTFVPQLLEGVSEKDPKISECADDAAKAMMRNLSDVGLRQLIPRLVLGLTSDQTKKRTPSLSFIGYVAFCSPKQLAATLPNIMKHITGCLFDANTSVSNAAFTALKRVAGVVSNPEIQEHVESILTAMRSPSTDTEAALDALLYTRFVNIVDPASLALIIPVIARGLGEMMNTKAKAAQIVASMVNLVADRKSLSPYVDDLLHRLENAAQDPQNEVRTTSAKAISSLAAMMGDEEFVSSITDWAFGVLRRGNTSAEKAGASQVLAEVIASCGEQILACNFDTIAEGMGDESPNVREGFMHLMVYAPSTLPTITFQNFLPASFPWVLRGLADFNERVRNVALLAGSSIIGLYGTRNLALVLKPLLDGVISETSNLRQSSMLLASKLLIHLVNQIKKKLRIETAETTGEEGEEAKEDAEAEDTSLAQGGEIRVETARDAEKRGVSILGSLEEQIGHESFIRILAAMHIGRCEHNLNVRNDCTTAWQICVASPRTAMTKIFSGIITMLVKFASSDIPECVDVAEKSVEYTCARLNENVERFVDRFSEEYKIGTKRHKVGALTCLASVVPFADSQRLMRMGGQIVACVLPGMQDDDETVQACAGLLFERVTKVVGSRLIESVVETQLSTSVRGVLEVVKVRPNVALAVIFKHLHGRSEYQLHDLDLIENILNLEQAEEDLPKYLEKINDILLVCIGQELEGACDIMTQFASVLPEHATQMPIAQFLHGMKQPSTRLATIRAVGAYGVGVDVEEVECLEAVLRIIIGALGDDDALIRDTASKLVIELLASIEKRVIENLEPEEQEDVTTARRIAGRFMLQFLDVFQSTLSVTARAFITSEEPEFAVLANVKLFDSFMAFYSKVLEWGTDPQRVQAVECIQDLFSFAPRTVAANAAAVTAGRCTKVLFARTSGAVALALTQVCLQLMKYPTGGKEKMVEGTLALAMFNAVLCDSGAARTTALRIVANLVKKTPAHGDVMLGNIVTKRASADTVPLKSIMCRFISFVMRGARIEKALGHVDKLMGIVRPMWESPESAALGAAAGSAVGALCMSASVPDETVAEIMKRALAVAATRGSQAVGAFACIYSLVISAPTRITPEFCTSAYDIVKNSAAMAGSDKLSSMWILRCVAALTKTAAKGAIRADPFYPLLRRIDENDEQMCSTSLFFCESVVVSHPDAILESYNQDKSTQWVENSGFDADLDDESVADVVF